MLGMKETKDYYYEDRVVAFIDILGFSELVKHSESNNDLINYILEALHEMDSMKRLKSEEDEEIGQCEIAVFSDTIVLSYKADFLHLLTFSVIYLQAILLTKGILVRGGISQGKLYHRDNIIFGPALIDAYLLESSSAKYPRVVIDGKLIERITGTLFIKDFDGLDMVDTLGNHFIWSHWEVINEINILETAKAVIEKKINESVNSDVKEKYQWLKQYYNSVVSSNKHYSHLTIS